MSLRDSVLGRPAVFKTKDVEFNGETFAVKQLSVKDRKVVLAKSTKKDGATDPYEFFVWATILCTVDPDNGKRVFEDTDYEALMEMPAGGIVDVLGAEAAKLLNGDVGEGND